jgi:chromosome segregation ATPase
MGGGSSSITQSMAALREEEHMIMRDMGRMNRDMERELARLREAKGAMKEVHAQTIVALEDRQAHASERLRELQLDLNALHQQAGHSASLARKRETVMALAEHRTEDTDRLLDEHAKLTGELIKAHDKIQSTVSDTGARKARVRAIMDGESLASAPLPPVRETEADDEEGDGLIKRLAALRSRT